MSKRYHASEMVEIIGLMADTQPEGGDTLEGWIEALRDFVTVEAVSDAHLASRS